MHSSTLQTKNEKDPMVAIVIPNWNGRHHLEACLPTIVDQEFRDFMVIVVDNASTDGSAAWIRETYPKVHLIENRANVGLCAANNQGIRTARTELVVMLNNDTRMEPDWLERMVRVIQQDSKIGMVACKMLLTDQPDMIESAGIVVDRSGIAWGLKSGEINDSRSASVRPVFGACGGAALYRRDMLLEIGLFDEDFFVYLEDADVAWRGQWAGWKCVYVPDAIVYHAHSATIKEGSPLKVRLLGRNKIWMICKNYPLPQLIWYSPLIVLYELMALGYALLIGRGHHALQGRWEGLTQIRKMLAKRKQVVRRVSPRTMIAMLYPVKSPLALLQGSLRIAQAATSSRPAEAKQKLAE